MMKLFLPVGKASFLIMLCVIFFSAGNFATAALGDGNKSAIQKTISGKVTDENGESLAGASVTVKGTTIGTLTDADGNYKITVPEDATSLTISFVGYLTKEVAIGMESVINIVLMVDVYALTDIVVVGYGTQRRSDLTGSISSVKGDNLTKLPVMRADQALQGQAAGVVVTNNDGAPGGNTTIRIRGSNSITGGNNALVVVDGFQSGNLSAINPNDIESIEVLKDASATAIYGSRGANGVILVTTKRGKLGAPVINYDYTYGVQKLGYKIDLLNGADYAQKENDYRATQNAAGTPDPTFTQAQIDALRISGGTDWQDEIYRKGILQSHQLSVNGGTDKSKYFVSAGYLDQKGLVIESYFKRFSLRSNLDVDLTKWLKTGFSVGFVKDKGNVPPFGEGTRYVDILSQVVNAVLRMDPVTTVYDANGNYSKSPGTYGNPDIWNPVATVYGTYNESNKINTYLNTFLEFKILKDLTLKVTGALDVSNEGKRTYYSQKTRNGSLSDGVGELTEDKSYYFQNSNILTYDKIFNAKHHLTLTGVAETQTNTSYGSFLQALGFFSDETGINDFGQASSIQEKNSYDVKRVINSFLGRINYSFADRYLLTVSYRADGSSVFGANYKWGFFPSASLAWKVSEEEFIKNLNIFSDFKIRGSWGKTGNQAINPYATLAMIGSGYNYPYNGSGTTDIGYAAIRAANPNLKWETTNQSDIGLDLGFFKGRLTATVDLYKKVTTDLLLNRPIPAYTGLTLLMDNVGSVQNKGIEFSMGGVPLTGDFKWNTSANITINRSKVITLLEGQTMMPIRTNTGGGYQIYASGQNNALMNLEVGESFGVMRGFVNLGTWSEAERDSAAAYGQLPGDTKYLDVNKDGQISTTDLTRIGNTSPKFVFGWNNDLSYKGFALSFLFQGSYGNDIFNATRIHTENTATGTSTALLDRWTIDNQNTDVPAFTDQLTREAAGLTSKVNLGKSAYNRSSRWVEDGSYIRLKSIILGYNLPKSLISKVGLSNFRVYVSGSNLLTITKYSGYDPEVSSYNVGTDAARGIDLSNYPTAITITFGVNLTF